MNDRRFQRLVSTLLLAVFCLGQTLVGTVAVRCTDSSGESRIEVVCSRSDVGSCLTTGCEPGPEVADLHDEGAADSHEPCRDEPVGQAVCRAKLIPQPLLFDPLVLEAADLPPWVPACDPVCVQAPTGPVRPERERPPDSTDRLSTVILLV